MSPVVSELILHAVCICFKFRPLHKQIPTLHNIINLTNIQPLVILYICSYFYFIFEQIIQIRQNEEVFASTIKSIWLSVKSVNLKNLYIYWCCLQVPESRQHQIFKFTI